ncbi:MAG: hypothetical protein KJ718_00660 [Nanoarchaeota archaeon]|nr:hypothetical protein [Nanoarchaeota archaeon]MBU1051052.1 hypothetical protein [Nanoarchaeota archaeon]MBU1988107.1 hypothetical protein [Nanoarchaeota archaeon]
MAIKEVQRKCNEKADDLNYITLTAFQEKYAKNKIRFTKQASKLTRPFIIKKRNFTWFGVVKHTTEKHSQTKLIKKEIDSLKPEAIILERHQSLVNKIPRLSDENLIKIFWEQGHAIIYSKPYKPKFIALELEPKNEIKLMCKKPMDWLVSACMRTYFQLAHEKNIKKKK